MATSINKGFDDPNHRFSASTLRATGFLVREVRLLLALIAPMAAFGTKTLWEHFGL